ncbi:DUF998 domain-containing protein [Phytomonospora sp. NPDC050363]|uniref:DUF998 domain-containing protein n=1 Tax=Phytomonospora sp. NPDC050363 TaxID=3155642 RepID=UPI0033F14283
MSTITAPATPTGERVARRSTRVLLAGAMAAGPVFYASSLAQALARDGFDIRVHPLSQLATGGPGWVQAATFVLAGLGAAGFAVARRRVVSTGVGARLVPVFVAVFGVAFALAGCFPMDAQNGFPVGAPAGAVEMSWHSVVHTVAAAVSFLALAAACVTSLVASIRGRRVWPSVGHALVALVLLMPVSPTESSVQIAVTGAMAFAWVGVSAARSRRAR